MQKWILVECAGCLDVINHAQQIVNGVGVLLPAQPIMLQRTALGQALGRSLADSPRQFIDDSADLVRSRLLFLLRRHLAGVDAKPHLAPFLRDQRIREVGREIIEPELALLFFAIVTPETVRLEKCAGGNFKPFDTIRIGNHCPQHNNGCHESLAVFENAHGRRSLDDTSNSSGVASHSSAGSSTYVHGPFRRTIRPGRKPSSICGSFTRS